MKNLNIMVVVMFFVTCQLINGNAKPLAIINNNTSEYLFVLARHTEKNDSGIKSLWKEVGKIANNDAKTINVLNDHEYALVVQENPELPGTYTTQDKYNHTYKSESLLDPVNNYSAWTASVVNKKIVTKLLTKDIITKDPVLAPMYKNATPVAVALVASPTVVSTPVATESSDNRLAKLKARRTNSSSDDAQVS